MARFFYFAGTLIIVIAGVLPLWLRLNTESPLGLDIKTAGLLAAQGMLGASIPGLVLIGIGAILSRLDMIVANGRRGKSDDSALDT